MLPPLLSLSAGASPFTLLQAGIVTQYLPGEVEARKILLQLDPVLHFVAQAGSWPVRSVNWCFSCQGISREVEDQARLVSAGFMPASAEAEGVLYWTLPAWRCHRARRAPLPHEHSSTCSDRRPKPELSKSNGECMPHTKEGRAE